MPRNILCFIYELQIVLTVVVEYALSKFSIKLIVSFNLHLG